MKLKTVKECLVNMSNRYNRYHESRLQRLRGEWLSQACSLEDVERRQRALERGNAPLRLY